MSDKIELLDISHHNTVSDWQKMVDAGIKGVYIKFSQGIDYKDPKAKQHYDNAKKVGLPVGPYHFVTNENGIKQYNNFIAAVGNLKFEFTPMMDAEAYNVVTSSDKLVALNNIPGDQYAVMEDVEKEYPVLELRYGNINQIEAYKMGELLGYSYPTEAIVDVIGTRLAGFQGFPYPVIYTNPSSGNKIFKTKSMKKYPLMIAHWGVPTPTMPFVWLNEEYYSHQDGVYAGDPYGVLDKVDHQYWGKKVPFPGDVNPPPPPPPPVEEEITIVAYPKEGRFEGKIKKV